MSRKVWERICPELKSFLLLKKLHAEAGGSSLGEKSGSFQTTFFSLDLIFIVHGTHDDFLA